MSPLSLPLASIDSIICLEDIYFTRKQIKVDDSKADDSMSFEYGVYYRLQPILLKTFSTVIVPVVTEIFNKIIDEQEFPKSGRKQPLELCKKELRIDVKIYRPVSMLCALSLIFKKLLYRKFRDSLLKN